MSAPKSAREYEADARRHADSATRWAIVSLVLALASVALLVIRSLFP